MHVFVIDTMTFTREHFVSILYFAFLTHRHSTKTFVIVLFMINQNYIFYVFLKLTLYYIPLS